MVRAVAEAMERPVMRTSGWHLGFRRSVLVAAAAASLMLLAVGTGMAQTAMRWVAARFEAGRTSAVEVRVPSAGAANQQSTLPAVAGTTSRVECVAPSSSAATELSPPVAPRQLEKSAVLPAPPPSVMSAQTDLASQNQLYTQAMNARRRGDSAAALRALDEFIGAYPQSPLVQDAHVARFRTLAETGDSAAAARAARAYLAAFPRGFAREEAAALVAK
jgi:TolA-binding protein